MTYTFYDIYNYEEGSPTLVQSFYDNKVIAKWG